MDADFSHDPADLPRLIAASDGADLVLGSRYVPGGGVTRLGAPAPARQPRRLRLRARDARRAGARPHGRLQVLPAAGAGGHRPPRRSTPTAMRFQIEVTYRAARAGFSVVEVPIVFRERQHGKLEDDARDRARGDLEGARAPHAVVRRSRQARLYFICIATGDRADQADGRGAKVAGSITEVTDTNFQAEVLEAEQGRARRLLGALVRPLPHHRPEPGGDRRRARRPRAS